MALPNFSQTAMQWQIYNTPKNLVYQAGLDFTTYGSFTFNPKGSVQQTPNAGVQEATGVGIDNTGNMNPVSVAIGSIFTETVPAYTKTLVSLGASSPPVIITGAGGQATATFYTGIYPGSIAQSNVLGATKQAIAVYLPPGLMMMYAGLVGNVPDGWLYCNGAAISRVNYAPLFNAIGTTYGAGDGASTFNLPDTRGVAIRGWDNGRGLDTVNGTRAYGSYQADNLPGHQHETAFGGNSGSSLYLQIDANGNPIFGFEGISKANIVLPGNMSGQSGISINRALTGSYTPFSAETTMKNLAVNHIIKV